MSQEPRLISDTYRSLEPSCLRRTEPTLTVSVRAVPQLNAIGIVCSDMRRSVAFYGLLGIEFPEGNGHVEATMPNGVRLMLDTEEVISSFRPDWSRAAGNQLSLAFACDSPDDVDELYRASLQPASRARRSRGTRSGAQRYAQLSDPDGVPVDLFAAL